MIMKFIVKYTPNGQPSFSFLSPTSSTVGLLSGAILVLSCSRYRWGTFRVIMNLCNNLHKNGGGGGGGGRHYQRLRYSYTG